MRSYQLAIKMGVYDKIKKKVKNSVQNAKDTMQYNKEVKRSKRNALDVFTHSQLKKLCDEDGIGHPPLFTNDPLTGEKIKHKLDKREYTNYIVRKSSLEFIMEFARRHNIRLPANVNIPEKVTRISPVLQETVPEPDPTRIVETVRLEPDPVFDSITSFIETTYQNIIQDQFFQNEYQFNDNLVSALRSAFGNRHNIDNRRQRKDGSGDILIDGKYVFELKYADNEGTLARGMAELKRYQGRFDKICMILLNTGRVYQGKIQEYVQFYKDDHADSVIVLQAQGKRG